MTAAPNRRRQGESMLARLSPETARMLGPVTAGMSMLIHIFLW